MRAPGPIRVAVVDVARPVGDLDCTRAEGPPYTGAWILVCRTGQPLGALELPLNGTPVIPAERLEHELRAQFADDAALRVPREPPRLAHASVVVPTNAQRAAQLRRCLDALARLDHPDYEVIVVD